MLNALKETEEVCVPHKKIVLSGYTGMDTLAVQKAPAFSTSETRFFVASSVPVLNALATHDGRILWEYQGEAEFASAPKASPDDKYVYSIQVRHRVRNFIFSDEFRHPKLTFGAIICREMEKWLRTTRKTEVLSGNLTAP